MAEAENKSLGRYTCASCKQTFEAETTEAEATAEYRRLYPSSKWEDRTIVCDDCFKKINKCATAQTPTNN